jgi:NAD(P)-dependent dehydrogenase (short-subunit alcohol dehydrogenase family)
MKNAQPSNSTTTEMQSERVVVVVGAGSTRAALALVRIWAQEQGAQLVTQQELALLEPVTLRAQALEQMPLAQAQPVEPVQQETATVRAMAQERAKVKARAQRQMVNRVPFSSPKPRKAQRRG